MLTKRWQEWNLLGRVNQSGTSIPQPDRVYRPGRPVSKHPTQSLSWHKGNNPRLRVDENRLSGKFLSLRRNFPSSRLSPGNITYVSLAPLPCTFTMREKSLLKRYLRPLSAKQYILRVNYFLSAWEDNILLLNYAVHRGRKVNEMVGLSAEGIGSAFMQEVIT